MLIEQHDLPHEFPEYGARIEALKASNEEFARLAGEYEAVNKEIVAVEEGAEVMDGFSLEDLKKKRLRLKDELYAMLRAADGSG
ncbi:MAG: DUF465 domain-containing protein [Burkholderiales bacterium]|nr:MAG: DUF465 domain-containing protein [Burkholderiales bacterium]